MFPGPPCCSLLVFFRLELALRSELEWNEDELEDICIVLRLSDEQVKLFWGSTAISIKRRWMRSKKTSIGKKQKSRGKICCAGKSFAKDRITKRRMSCGLHIICSYCGKPLYRSIPNGTAICGIGVKAPILNQKVQALKIGFTL